MDKLRHLNVGNDTKCIQRQTAQFHKCPSLHERSREIHERETQKMEENQTKCELLVTGGALALKCFYVMRATALTFRKTSITICKATHF